MEIPLNAGRIMLAGWLFGGPMAAAAEMPSKEALLWAQLKERVGGVERSLNGVLGVAIKDMKTGATIEIRSTEVFPTASVIKVALLYELYRQADEGRVDLAEIVSPTLPRVSGGGVLQELGDRVSLTLRDLAVLTAGWSDNEATNILIARVGMDAVNHRLDTLGLGGIRLRRRMMDLAAARRGDENVATPLQLTRLMEVVHAGTGLSEARAKDLVAILSTEKWGTGATMPSPFRAGLPEGTPVADKGGELEGVRAVTALVRLPGRPYAATVMTAYLHRDADGDAAIREISAALFDTFDRLARSSEYGRVISER
jgi:beta-lactamase class A